MQYVPNKTTIWWWGGVVAGIGGLSDSVRQFIAISKAWTTVQMATAKWYTDFHSQALKPCWPTRLSSIISLEALLRLMYFSLTAFHFYILM